MSQKKYQHYQAVKGGWFTQIPTHWKMQSSNRVFEQKREPAEADDEQLSVTQKYGVMPQNLFMAMDDRKVTLALAGTDNFKHVEKGDFVISLRSFEGGIELSQYKGCISPAYTCLRARKAIAEGYYKFTMKSKDFISALQSVTQGIRDGKNISYAEFSKLSIPYPPAEEQTEIARFLDRETAKIDALITEQEQLIELLHEKRQAVISHAVTKGLNPNAPMKESGVEWLGEVPEHWPIKKLGHSCFMQEGPGLRSWQFTSEGTRVICVTNITPGGISFSDYEKYISTQEFEESYKRFKVDKGDIIISSSGNSWGKLAIFCGNEEVMLNTSTIRIRELNSEDLNRGFLMYLLESISTREQLSLAMTGSCQPNFGPSHLTRVKAGLPSIAEQAQICEWLDIETDRIKRLQSYASKTIELLRDRRTAVISAAVTGQIDVRGLMPAEEVT